MCGQRTEKTERWRSGFWTSFASTLSLDPFSLQGSSDCHQIWASQSTSVVGFYSSYNHLVSTPSYPPPRFFCLETISTNEKKKKNLQHNCTAMLYAIFHAGGGGRRKMGQTWCHIWRTANLETHRGIKQKLSFVGAAQAIFLRMEKYSIHPRAVSPRDKCCNQNSSRQA